MTEQTEPQPVAKKKMSTGAKVGIGCGVGCLVVVLALAIMGFFGYRYAKGKIDTMAKELRDMGFANVSRQQLIEIHDTVNEPMLYIGQSVKLYGRCTTNVAIMAQIAELHGEVDGTVYFRGQMLIILPNAVVHGDLDLMAQAIQNLGTVEGEIRGDYQVLDKGEAQP